MKSLEELQDAFEKAHAIMDAEIEEKWNSLSKEDQLYYFCAVVKRIHQGEVEKPRSYRGVLYDVFGFGPEAYAMAQLSGYLDLHNLIYTHDYEKKLLKEYGKYFANRFGIAVENQDQLVADFQHNGTF